MLFIRTVNPLFFGKLGQRGLATKMQKSPGAPGFIIAASHDNCGFPAKQPLLDSP
jgi:hypothetical protein